MLTDLMGGEMTASSRPGQGTLFRVRLFLPSLHGVRTPVLAAPRGGYAGKRQRVLVVNKVDRTLLSQRLQELGFDVLQAGSGPAALGLLREQTVDAILTDLAMPGIDGWETIRTLRRQNLSTAPVAIVSANALDKGQDNDVGIGPADFITKPVRLDELLDWLCTHLGLQWQVAPAAAPAAQALLQQSQSTPPARPQLLALLQVVKLGNPRGVHKLLDQIEAATPQASTALTPHAG